MEEDVKSLNSELSLLKQDIESSKNILENTKNKFACDIRTYLGKEIKNELSNKRKLTLWEKIKWKLFKRL